MATPITIPRLGWNMEEGIFAGWLRRDGDEIRPGDALFSLESEKATENIESLDSGILRLCPGGPAIGDKLPVGAVIAYLVEPGESMPSPPATAKATPAALAGAREPAESQPAKSTIAAPATAHPISPRARRVARELGIDTAGITGTGRTGRIREADIRAAAGHQKEPLDRIRRIIGERMVHSLRTTAPVTLTTTVDATHFVQWREFLKAQAKGTQTVVPGYTEILMWLSAKALRQHPYVNAYWAGEKLIVSQPIHIGVAVDTKFGLVVPVVRDVSTLALPELTSALRDLIERARARTLKTRDMEGGTFSVTNLGPFGIEAFTPIIHYPQVAILGIGRIERRPAVIGNDVVVREQMSLSLTFDHRAMDGAPAARFLQALAQQIESAELASLRPT